MKRINRISRIYYALIRLYTPFICTIAALVNGVYLLWFEEQIVTEQVYLFATITGNSILVDEYMFATSRRMCIWYKLNIRFLLVVQILGLCYNYFNMDEVLYLHGVVISSGIGFICFVIFKVFYKVTGLLLCTYRYLPKS